MADVNMSSALVVNVVLDSQRAHLVVLTIVHMARSVSRNVQREIMSVNILNVEDLPTILRLAHRT